MISPAVFVKIAQSAAGDPTLLEAIQGAYTEVGRNNLEQLLLLHLHLDAGEDVADGRDIVSDFFTVFG